MLTGELVLIMLKNIFTVFLQSLVCTEDPGESTGHSGHVYTASQGVTVAPVDTHDLALTYLAWVLEAKSQQVRLQCRLDKPIQNFG